MPSLSEPKQRRHHLGSSRSIRLLLERRWLVVVLALMLTGLGAAITGLLFTRGINLLRDWRLNLLDDMPAWVVLPALGAFGGMVSAWLVTRCPQPQRGSRHHPHHGLPPAQGRSDGAAGGPGETGGGHHRHRHPDSPSDRKVRPFRWADPWPGRCRAGCGHRWRSRRVIVAAGGGAGIAAVFSAPIGGFIYAIEELLHSARPVVLLLVIITTFSADTWADVLGRG